MRAASLPVRPPPLSRARPHRLRERPREVALVTEAAEQGDVGQRHHLVHDLQRERQKDGHCGLHAADDDQQPVPQPDHARGREGAAREQPPRRALQKSRNWPA